MKLLNTIIAVTLSHYKFLESRLKILFWGKNNHGSWSKKVRIRLNPFPDTPTTFSSASIPQENACLIPGSRLDSASISVTRNNKEQLVCLVGCGASHSRWRCHLTNIPWLNKELVGSLSPPYVRLPQLPMPYFKVGTKLWWDYLLQQHICYPRGHQLSVASTWALGPAGSSSDWEPDFCFYPTNSPHASPWCLWLLVAGSSEDGVSQAEGRSFLVSLTMLWSQPSVSKTGRHGFLLPPGLVSLFSGAVLLPRAAPGWCDLREGLLGEQGAKA